MCGALLGFVPHAAAASYTWSGSTKAAAAGHALARVLLEDLPQAKMRGEKGEKMRGGGKVNVGWLVGCLVGWLVGWLVVCCLLLI